MKILFDLPQRTEQWFRARAGRVTASNFHRIITDSGKKSAQWEQYAIELCCSCLRPDEIQFEGNLHTDRGESLEPEAREVFTKLTGLPVTQVGMVLMDNNIITCSPDGLIFTPDGTIAAGIEIKCPLSKNHAQAILGGQVPARHAAQVHGSLIVTGAPCWYYMSYCPGLRPFIIQVTPNDYTHRLQSMLEDFVVYYASMRSKVLPQISPLYGEPTHQAS